MNHIAGAIAAIARPPSNGVSGTRLRRLIRKPTYASARSIELSVASAIAKHTAAPAVPRIGPARPTRASASASSGICFIPTTAPRNGTKIGAVALIPSRRNWIT
jgi:hypothetical protein